MNKRLFNAAVAQSEITLLPRVCANDQSFNINSEDIISGVNFNFYS
jgi:hypothetical protein